MRLAGILSIGVLTGAAGCSPTGKGCDTEDTASTDESCDDTGSAEPAPDTPSFDNVTWSCDYRAFWYDVRTVGWTGDGSLEIIETGDTGESPHQEQHPLPSVSSDPDGWWDQLYVELEILQEPYCSRDIQDTNACWQYQESGKNTLWTCDSDTIDRLTWAVTIYSPDDPTEVVGCQSWGQDPSVFPDCEDTNPTD